MDDLPIEKVEAFLLEMLDDEDCQELIEEMDMSDNKRLAKINVKNRCSTSKDFSRDYA